MGLYEPKIVQFNLFLDDAYVMNELRKKNLVNMRLNSSYDYKDKIIKEDKTASDLVEFQGSIENYDEDIVYSILGEKEIIPKYDCGWDIIIVNSIEDFIWPENFKGLVVSINNDLSTIDKEGIFYVSSREEAVNLISSLYYIYNSYHVLPYGMENIFPSWSKICRNSIIVDKIAVCKTGKLAASFLSYKHINSDVMHQTIIFFSSNERYCITGDRAERGRRFDNYYEDANKFIYEYYPYVFEMEDEDINYLFNYTKEVDASVD